MLIKLVKEYKYYFYSMEYNKKFKVGIPGLSAYPVESST